MSLSQEQLDKFNDLYYEQFGERLSPQETLNQGLALLNLMKTIYKPIPKLDDN